MSPKWLALFSICMLAVLSTATPTRSWDCAPYLRSGKCPEKAICQNSDLMALDEQLRRPYYSIMVQLPVGLAGEFRKSETAWLAQRDRCGCEGGCLRTQYESRIAQLERTVNAQPPSSNVPPKTQLTLVETGTAFFINSKGDLLTNNHVIEGCLTVSTMDGGVQGKPLSVKVADRVSDLAVVETNDHRPGYARLSARLPRTAERIVVIGFPGGSRLAEDASVTTGNIMGLSVAGSRERMRISAPVNTGNSGGPVLADNGAVLGIVVATLDLAHDVSAAINVAIVQSFLESFGVTFETETSQKKLDEVTIARQAVPYTRMLGCFKND